MKYQSLGHTANIHEEKMLGRKISESVSAAEIQFQAKKAKRYRSAFTTEQINYLEKQFNKFPYIGNACRKEVASVLNIPERAIKIWFQNRRMKEKKEVINKEYNLERPNNFINNAEFANDPLNNVHSSQSTNDHHQCSLQPALSNHVNKINCTNYHVEAKKSGTIKSERNIKEKVVCDQIYQLGNKNKNNIEKPTISKRIPSTSENLSKHLNKVYNNNDFIKYLKTNKSEAINKCILAPKKKIKENFKSGNQPIQAVSNNSLGTINYQDSPEDLSARNKSNVTFPKTPENINLSSAFIPFCNTQNYIAPCISAGSVMWKPINVMPIISSPASSSLPITIPNNELSQINMVQNPCNCNCHMKNLINHEQGKTLGTSHPQYVIAIPINKMSS